MHELSCFQFVCLCLVLRITYCVYKLTGDPLGMNCPLHFHLSSPTFPFPSCLLGFKFFQYSAEMFSVKHSQKLSYPWGKLSIRVPTKSFPLSQWCWSEDFFPAVTPSFPVPQHQVWDFCFLTQFIFFPCQEKQAGYLEYSVFLSACWSLLSILHCFVKGKENIYFLNNKNLISAKLKFLKGLKGL